MDGKGKKETRKQRRIIKRTRIRKLNKKIKK